MLKSHAVVCVPVIELILSLVNLLLVAVVRFEELFGDLVHIGDTRANIIHLRLQSLEPTQPQRERFTAMMQYIYTRAAFLFPFLPTHLCWTTSRSSNLDGISMVRSHCSFSPIQSLQALASLYIRYSARAPSRTSRRDEDRASNSS